MPSIIADVFKLHCKSITATGTFVNGWYRAWRKEQKRNIGRGFFL